MSDPPIKVFLSYARKDAPDHACILELLQGLENQGVIEPWWDGCVNPGDDWNEEILSWLEAADLILLLVSRLFLASSFCMNKEMIRAMQRHDAGEARVIPTALRDCHWGRTPFAKLQAPEEVKPILAVRGPRRDTLLKKIARDLDSAAEQLAVRKATPCDARPQPAMEVLPHLPPRPPHCFGRDVVIEELVGVLTADQPGPVVVTGGPGFGKSTVTLRALHDPRTAARFGQRRWFVRLDGATTADAVWSGIGQTLGVSSGPEPRQAVLLALSERPAALALDNFETPWHADMVGSEAVPAELAGLPGCALVVTIRGGKWPGGVGWGSRPAMGPLGFADARTAFLAVAGEEFAADQHLDDLVRAQDGIPLALELLASACQAEPDLSRPWCRWQSEKTEMLQRGSADDRLYNIGISFELSISGPLMTGDGKRLLGLLGVLPDGISDQDLGPLLPETGERAAALLVALGLAFRQSGRLRVLAPIREYVAAHHPPDGDDFDRCMDHFVTLARELGHKPWRDGGADALARLTPETGNLAAMLGRALAATDPVPAIEATIAYGNFQVAAGHRSLALLNRAIFAARRLDRHDLEACCEWGAGQIALYRSEHDVARSRFGKALDGYRRGGDVKGVANCIKQLGLIAFDRSEYEIARSRFEEALPLYRRTRYVLGEMHCIRRLGDIALELLDYESARSRYEEALPLYRQLKSFLGEANCIERLGDIAFQNSEYESAGSRYKEALPLFRGVGDGLGLSAHANGPACAHGMGAGV